MRLESCFDPAVVAALTDPLSFQKMFWPGVRFYEQERQVVMSVKENLETLVTAGNKLGKDYTAAYVALSFFIRPQMYFDADYVAHIESLKGPSNRFPHTRRVVTTSVAADHLRVLWAEIGGYITNCSMPLLHDKGGPLSMNFMEIRFAHERLEVKTPPNYLVGLVAETPEKLAGHHAAYTLLIGDEASGLSDKMLEQTEGWAKRFLLFGNPNFCENRFRRGVDGGDIPAT